MSEVSKQIMSQEDHGGWRPIDSAPKDGTVVLLFSAPMAERYAQRVAFWRDGFDDWYSLDLQPVHHPTHWRPLPPAPDEA